MSTFGGPGTGPGSSTAPTTSRWTRAGNLFITETYEGKRVQKFTYTGLGPPSLPPAP